jgi:hypothetical protein
MKKIMEKPDFVYWDLSSVLWEVGFKVWNIILWLITESEIEEKMEREQNWN